MNKSFAVLLTGIFLSQAPAHAYEPLEDGDEPGYRQWSACFACTPTLSLSDLATQFTNLLSARSGYVMVTQASVRSELSQSDPRRAEPLASNTSEDEE